MALAELTYGLTAAFPRHEVYGLSSQMRRAAVSVPSNIAEGAARASRKEFRYFVHIAKGSAWELQTQLLLAARLTYISEAQLLEAETLAVNIARMLNGLANSLKSPPLPPPNKTETPN